ncbi:MAG: hypothetical protein KDK70_19970 [Myxococcales bacterium]|nr:hypothetical protein [Myxococcales bacterium]
MRLRWLRGALLVLAACRSTASGAGPAAPSEVEPPRPAVSAAAAEEPEEPKAREDPEDPEDPRRPAVLARLSRIGIVGASQTAGFGTGVGFGDTLRAALLVPHRVHDSSVALMHLGALEVGRLQITSMKLRGVGMVFAVDFLFWFAHGDKTFEQRRDDLHEGMALLESLAVPVFVGDLPDVHGASRRMIGSRMIPAADERLRLNAEIHAWAEARAEIHVLPLAAWMEALMLEQAVQLEGQPVQLSVGEALQWDRLHPTARGQALLTLLVLQELRAAWGGLGDRDVHHRPATVAELAVPSRAPAPEGALATPPP